MIKRAYAQGPTTVELVAPGTKTAQHCEPSAARTFLENLCPDPRYTFVLVNAMGYSEYYGANSNTDWYGYNPHLDFNGLLNAWPGIGADSTEDAMKAKAWGYGYPCFYNAACYAHHRNTDPQRLGFGDVIFVAPNPHMKRIELVMRVFNEEAKAKGHTNFLDRLQAGERVDVSMGAKVPFDLCSVCTDWAAVKEAWKTFDPTKHAHPGIAILLYHKTVKPIRGLAVTKADYCSCMKTQRGKILSTGEKIFVFNDFPRFFDISFVWIGADRTARAMGYLGPNGPGITPRAVPQVNLTSLLSSIFQARPKTASILKEIDEGHVIDTVQSDAETAPTMSSTVLDTMSKTVGAKSLLSTLAGLGVVVKPDEFQTIVLAGLPQGSDMIRNLVKSKFVFDAHTPRIDDEFGVDPNSFDASLGQKLSFLLGSRSGFSPYLEPRLEDKTALLLPQAALLKVAKSAVLDDIGAKYNGYRLSVLEKSAELFPRVTDIDPSLLASKTASMAPLLLGLGPVIHFISSHLRQKSEEGKQLGMVGKFLADNPTFTTVATVGAALRTAMKVQQMGGLGAAAKTLVSAAAKLF